MDILFLIIGAVVGAALVYIVNMRSKSDSVRRADYDALHTQIQNERTQQRVLEERLTNKQNDMDRIGSELQVVQREFGLVQTDKQALQNQVAELGVHLEAAQNLVVQERDAKAKLSDSYEQLLGRLQGMSAEHATLTANNEALQERLLRQKEEMMELQRTSQLEFEKIATRIFEEKSDKFTQQNKINLDALLQPLGANIDAFRKKVEETYDRESKERFSLGDRVRELVEQTQKVSDEANNLATALKGGVKKQGNWGEIILESILEQSGLVKGREYFVQQTIMSEEGKAQRPDVVVQLPDNRHIIIDSKVSLLAYDRYVSADTPEAQTLNLREHIASIKAHVDGLAPKNYHDLESSLDFVMMFVPIEPAYMLAIQNDPNLWAYAYVKQILLISPTNLIACLKLIADLWKRELQSKNAQEIVKKGESLYNKFVGFATTFEEIGTAIERSEQAYSKARGQLSEGKGNVTRLAMQLRDLGLKSEKLLPEGLDGGEE